MKKLVRQEHDLQNVINQFTRIAQDERVQFLGNVNVGQDIQLRDHRRYYSAVRCTMAFGAALVSICSMFTQCSIRAVAVAGLSL